MTLLFSVSICVYGKDNPEWFQLAVDSILQQSIKPAEIVLVVDGPVPKKLECLIKSYETIPLFKIIWLQANVGHGRARRIGLENCSNDLVALMDADDISKSDRFEKQLAAFEAEPSISVLGGMIAEFTENPQNVIGYRLVPKTHRDIVSYLKKRCPMNQMTVMFRKSDVIEAGGYLDWYCNEDYYLWIRMYQNGMKFANLDSVLVNVRIGEDMYKRRGGWKYFLSEWKLQNYMLANKVIDPVTYGVNVAKRFVVQVLLPNQLRGYVFQKFARKKDVQ